MSAFFDRGLEVGERGVVFAGNPYTLTRERPDLIVRFFCALALYGKEPGPAEVGAITLNAPRLAEIDRALLFARMREVFSLPVPRVALELMQRESVLKYAIGFPVEDFALCAALENIEHIIGKESAWQVRLVLVLLGAKLPPETALAHLEKFWHLPPAEKEYLEQLLEYFPAAAPEMPEEQKTALVRSHDRHFLRSLFLLRWTVEENPEAVKVPYLAALRG